MAIASPSVESPNAKSWRIRGARLAVRKPGSTPATISAVPVTIGLDNRFAIRSRVNAAASNKSLRASPFAPKWSGLSPARCRVQVLQRVGAHVRQAERRPRLGEGPPEISGLRRRGHQQPLLLVLMQDERGHPADRLD